VSRDDGFMVMDVSVAIHEDAKFKALARRHPELVAEAFLAYVAVMGESWSAGCRVPVADNWPRLIPYRAEVERALKRFRLVDGKGLVWFQTWEHWFGPAAHRQEQSRERWRRANEKRHAAALASLADTTEVPRGNSAATAATVPSVPSVPTVLLEETTTPIPPPSGGRRANGTNPRAVAAALTRQVNAAEAERKARRKARHIACLDGRLTEAQRLEMDERDAPLSEIPTKRGAAYQGATP
jgi:hypothetical protein